MNSTSKAAIWKKWWVWLIAILIIAAIVIPATIKQGTDQKADSSHPKTASASTSSNVKHEKSSSKPALKPKVIHLKKGESGTVGGVEITLNAVHFSKGGSYDKSKKGQFLITQLTAKNVSKEEQVISSIATLTIQDQSNHSYDMTLLLQGTGAPFDGELTPEEELQGEVAFDVPVLDTYQVSYKDPFGRGQIIWTIPGHS